MRQDQTKLSESRLGTPYVWTRIGFHISCGTNKRQCDLSQVLHVAVCNNWKDLAELWGTSLTNKCHGKETSDVFCRQVQKRVSKSYLCWTQLSPRMSDCPVRKQEVELTSDVSIVHKWEDFAVMQSTVVHRGEWQWKSYASSARQQQLVAPSATVAIGNGSQSDDCPACYEYRSVSLFEMKQHEKFRVNERKWLAPMCGINLWLLPVTWEVLRAMAVRQ